MFVIFWFSGSALSMDQSYQEGVSLADILKKDFSHEAPSLLSNYKGEKVPETELQPHILSDKANEAMKKPEGQILLQTQKERGVFDIDPRTDPLFIQGDLIVKDPEKVLGATKEEIKAPARAVLQKFFCEEEGEAALYTGYKTLNIVVREKSQKYLYARVSGIQFKRVGKNKNAATSLTRGPYWASHDSYYNYIEYQQLAPCNINYFDGCNNYPHTVTPVYGWEKFFPGETPISISQSEFLSPILQESDTQETWVGDTAALDERAQRGECAYVSKACIQGPETRKIGSYSITRPCWKESYTYACRVPVKNTCKELREKGCIQVASICAQKQDDSCLSYRQTFECKTAHQEVIDVRLSGEGIPYCLDGNCNKTAAAVDEDFADVMSKLSIFKEMALDKDMTGYFIFKGKDLRCDRNIASFRDCCGGCSGWGVSLGLGNCSENEKLLFKERLSGKCHFVGEHCAEKVMGVCIRKTKTYCCFGTKLSRIVQEQGRAQLNLDWGTSEEPVCRGLAIDEITRVDFSKIDLKEIFDDLLGRVKQVDLGKIQTEWKTQWSSKQETLKPTNIQRKSNGL